MVGRLLAQHTQALAWWKLQTFDIWTFPQITDERARMELMEKWAGLAGFTRSPWRRRMSAKDIQERGSHGG